MPVPLLDDGVSVTYQLDDGSTVKVAKDAAMRIGAPLPPSGPPPVAPTLPGGPGAAPSIIPSPAQSASPVSAAPPPLVPPPVVDTFAGAPGSATQPPPEMAPPAPAPLRPSPASAAGGAVQGASANSAPPPAPAPPTRFGAVTAEHDQGEQMQEQALRERAIAEQAGLQRTVNVLEGRNTQLDTIRQKQEADQAASMKEIERRSSAVDAAMADYSKTKIDPHRAWNSMSGAGKAGLIFFQVLSGLGQALKHQGDKNPAVDMWLHQVDQDIRLQMDAREQKRDQIGQAKDALNTFRDLAQTRAGQYSLAMAAETDKAAKTLEAIATQTKSDTVKSNALDAMGLLKQQSAAFKGSWAQAEFQSDLAVKELNEKIRAAKVGEGIAGGHLALANKEFKEGVRRFDLDYAQKERMHKDDLDEKIALAKSSGKTSEAKQLEDERKFSVGAPTTVAKDKAGNVVRNEDGSAQVVRESLKNKDGTPWLARNEQQADEFGNKIAVAGEINDILNEVQSIRDDVGAAKLAVTKYSPIPSDAKARLDVLQNRLVVLAKSGTQGMSSDEDMQKLSATLGAKDLAAFTTNAAGLKEAQARTQSQLNREARVRYNYSGPPITFDDVQKVSANPADKAYEAVAKGQTREQLAEGATPGKARRALEYVTGGGILYKSSNEKAEEAASGDATSPYGVTSDAQAGIDDLTRQMRSKDRGTAVNAKEKLVQLSKEHPDLAPAIAQSVRDQAPELWGVVKTQFPANAVKTAERSGSAGAFSDVTDFAPDAIARQALQDNAEGRRIAKEVMEASKSPDPAVRKAAADVLREAQRIQKGP